MKKSFTAGFLTVILPIVLIIIVAAAALYNIKTTSTQSKDDDAAGNISSGVTQSNGTTESDTPAKPSEDVQLKKQEYLHKAQELMDKTHYKKAREILTEALAVIPDDGELTGLMDKAGTAAENPVLYKGKIYHVFFHSLIVYPELCFTGDSMTQGYNYWMTTVREFKLMIEEMYQRGYTLVDLRDLFEKDASGKMVRRDLYLPEGQKPLIISVDDMSYYKYMENDGFAKRLVLDDEGNLASLVRTPENKEIVIPDGDVVPILNHFVTLNPDFSYKGAKGTLALTGYEGILGYRTNHDTPSWENEKESVIPVVNKLKETGWAFACHSYTHRRTFAEGTITLDFLKYDTQRWKDEVGSILGPTNLYISPFGAEFPQKDARFRYIVDQGFDVYCGVGARAYYELFKDNAYMERIDLDGYKMFYSPNVMKDLFDVEKVFDPARPPFGKKKQ